MKPKKYNYLNGKDLRGKKKDEINVDPLGELGFNACSSLTSGLVGSLRLFMGLKEETGKMITQDRESVHT